MMLLSKQPQCAGGRTARRDGAILGPSRVVAAVNSSSPSTSYGIGLSGHCWGQGPAPCRAAASEVLEFSADSAEELPFFDGSGSYDYYNNWYPVAFVKDLDKSKPHRFVLLDIPLVIWFDPNASAWRVFEDVCPHRLVPLSEGRITKAGLLECGYHGWAFSSSGRCEVVPQQGKKDTPRACATAYHAAVKQGLIFVLPRPLPPALLPGGAPNEDLGEALRLAAEEEKRIPLVAELEEPGWCSQDVWRDLPYDWSSLMENVLDSSHVPFTHHASMSNRNVIGPYDLKLTTPISEAGFNGTWKTGPRAGKLGPQTTTYAAPSFMKHRLDAKGFASLTVVYAVPMSPGKCRLINRNVLRFGNPLPETFFKFVPSWWWHVSSNVLLEDDQIFLHLGEEETARRRASGLAHSQVCYMPSTADTYVIAFNKWLQRFGEGGPWGAADAGYVEALGARQSKEQLLDRYSQHTAECASCQQGLKQVGAAQAIARGVTIAAGAAAILCAAVAVTAATTGVSATAAAAAAAASSSSTSGASAALSLAGDVLLNAMLLVTGGADASGTGHVLRAACWGVLAAAAALAGSQLAALREKFYKGVYPPPRNLKD